MKIVSPRPWMQYILIAAGVYNILWGAIAFFMPSYYLEHLNLSFPNAHWTIKAIGVMEILFGIAYIIANRKPFKHWLIIFIGFSVKIMASMFYFYYVYVGVLPKHLTSMILANDVVWLIPFGIILYFAFEHHQSTTELSAYDMNPRKLKSLENIHTNTGVSLQAHTDQHPTMLVFLRHFGCPFCREALLEISKNRKHIESAGTKIVLVHLVDEATAQEITKQYGIDDIPRIADPEKKIYKAFGLGRGTLLQLFGINVIIRGVIHAIFNMNPPRPFIGDGFQMPGIFVIHKGMVVQTFKHTSLADRPDYIELAKVEF